MDYVVTQLYTGYMSIPYHEILLTTFIIVGIIASYKDGQRNYRKYKYWDSVREKQKRGVKRKKAHR